MRINNNISALNAWRGLTNTDNSLSKSLEKLSSGLRINRAGDDAAGLAISEKMRGQIRGLNQAVRNAQDGISLIQTAEGALTETHAILQRMRELAVQSANDTNTEVDRGEIQKEMNQLAQEISRISDTTQFNKKTLLDGNFTDNKLQIGANSNQYLGLKIEAMDAVKLGVGIPAVASGAVLHEWSVVNQANAVITDGTEVNVSGYTQSTTLNISIKALTVGNGTDTSGTAEVTVNGVTRTITADTNDADSAYTIQLDSFGGIFSSTDKIAINASANWTADDQYELVVYGENPEITGLDVDSYDNAQTAIDKIDAAIESVSTERAKLGAWQNRLEHTIKNLGVAAENLSAAESRIRDVDMAAEMMNFTKQNILMQAGTAMLAQANARPQSVLQLLG